MPTSTFFNLPEEKRKKLICAIKDEFSRVPFDEVSINKIVQTAEIARGSFYQYFTDKNDMLDYIMLDYRTQMFNLISKSIKESNGDLFKLFTDIFDFAITFVIEEKTNSFCKNLLSDIRVNSGFYTKNSKGEMLSLLIDEVKAYVKFEVLDLRTETDFKNIVEILSTLIKDSIAEAFLEFSSYEDTKQDFLIKLDLLKRGFLKNKGETV